MLWRATHSVRRVASGTGVATVTLPTRTGMNGASTGRRADAGVGVETRAAAVAEAPPIRAEATGVAPEEDEAVAPRPAGPAEAGHAATAARATTPEAAAIKDAVAGNAARGRTSGTDRGRRIRTGLRTWAQAARRGPGDTISNDERKTEIYG